jgi:hypothetical protein
VDSSKSQQYRHKFTLSTGIGGGGGAPYDALSSTRDTETGDPARLPAQVADAMGD